MKILRISDVTSKTGLPKSSVYFHIKNGRFPKPIKLGARSSGWVESEVNEWLNQRAEASRKAGS